MTLGYRKKGKALVSRSLSLKLIFFGYHGNENLAGQSRSNNGLKYIRRTHTKFKEKREKKSEDQITRKREREI